MLFTLIALTLPLCLDSFLIAAAIGMSRPPHRSRLRISALFALFEGGMPLIGLVIGSSLSRSLGSLATYISVILLVGLGLYTVFKTNNEDKAAQELATANGLTMVALGISISLDGLAIGFTYGLLKLPVVPVTLLIAAQAFIASQIGFAIGGRLPETWRERGEQLAGWVLVAIGAVIFIESLVSKG